MSVVSKMIYKTEKNKFTPDQVLDSIFSILSKILAHTQNLENKPASIFDHQHKSDHLKQDEFDEIQSQDLNSSCSDSTSDDDSCCIIEKMNIEDFIILCYKRLDFDEHLLILSMMIFEKILAKDFVLTEKNIHKVFFLCMMEVQKFYNDANFTNKNFAKLCGMSTEELLELELKFLDFIDYNMNILDDDYFKYKKKFKNYFDYNVIIEMKYLE